MQTKRILLKEDKTLCNEITKDLRDFLPALNELKTSYEALEVGNFSNTVFKTLITTGTKETSEKFINQLNQQLDSLKITSSLIRENSISNHTVLIENLNESLRILKNFKPAIYINYRPKLTLKFISFDEVFLISSEDKENISESLCRIYLENESEIETFEAIKNLKNAFNEYLKIVENSTIPNMSNFNGIAKVLIINELNKAEVHPEGVKFLANYKSLAEKMI